MELPRKSVEWTEEWVQDGRIPRKPAIKVGEVKRTLKETSRADRGNPVECFG